MTARPLAFTLAVLVPFAGAGAASSSDSARAFLALAFDVTRADVARLDAGRVIARTLDATHRREVATLGVVRITTTADSYVERLTDIATFKRDDAILQIGTFSHPPGMDDVAGLTLEEADIRRLRDCRLDDCDVQLSSGAIERFRAEINWRSTDATRQANALMREILVQYVTDYVEAGAAAAMEYADTSPRLPLGPEFASLVAADTTTWPHVPRLRRHLLEFPATRGEGATDLVYWSKERVNGRPVISVTHLAILPASDDSPVAHAIASKQIYAMHYFDVSLGVTLLVPDPAASPAATYVAYLNRSRIDLFDGVFGGLARTIVSGKARTLVAEQLRRLQRTLGPAPTS